MPSLEVMTNCFEANPNGAGFMWKEGDIIHISKGYMTLDALQGALNQLDNPKMLEMVIHFRISTHGSSIPENTHPFPLSNSIDDLRALNIICERGLAHNGIMHDFGRFTNKESDLSDTMYFAKAISGVKHRFIEAMITPHVKSGSRFVYMSGKNKTITFGMTKPKGTGIWYSNTSYLKPVVTVYDTRFIDKYNFNGDWFGSVGKKQSLLETEKERDWQDMVARNRAAIKPIYDDEEVCDDDCDTCPYMTLDCKDKVLRELNLREAEVIAELNLENTRIEAFNRNMRKQNGFTKFIDGGE